MPAGPTMDMQVIREVFSILDEAASRLRADSAMLAEVRIARPQLAPNQIGKHCQLQEWLGVWDELEPDHRHLSPLWGLYPGREISSERTPDVAAAAAATLTRRGTGGWSYAWKMELRARLNDGELELDQFKALLAKSSLPNLFSLCGKALQIDGNLGATSAIAEMLVQSQRDVIHLLPAVSRIGRFPIAGDTLLIFQCNCSTALANQCWPTMSATSRCGLDSRYCAEKASF